VEPLMPFVPVCTRVPSLHFFGAIASAGLSAGGRHRSSALGSARARASCTRRAD
jgi:hypothetical protein